MDGVLTAGLPQYQPPSSLQPYYEALPPAFDSRPAQDPKPMYTYAEVNTPYYQYHYYSPVYKNNHHQPPIYEASSPEPALRNDVGPYVNGVSTTLKKLFYPATTNNPLSSPEPDQRNNGFTPRYAPNVQPFSPMFENRPEVYITSKPLTANNAFAPVLRKYQPSKQNKVYPSIVTPIFTPTELAAGFPNILRDTNGNDRNPDDTPLTINNSTFKPELTVSSTENSKLRFTPIVVRETQAKPSSNKEEVRRGISPPLVFRDQFSASSSKQASLEKSPFNTDTFTSTSSPQLSFQSKKYSELPVSDASVISANILRVFSSPNLELLQNKSFNPSDALPPEMVITKNISNVLNSSHSFTESTPQSSTQIPTGTTVTHLQKIAKKANPTVVPKKFLSKHPNVLFYSPGHDTPK